MKVTFFSKHSVNRQPSIVNRNLFFLSPFTFHLLSFLLLLASCNSSYVPRPRGYYKIDFPEKKYQLFNQPGYPYTFEYPLYANVVKDSTFFGEATENPWWINVNFPQFNSRLYVSYKQVGVNSFDKLLQDAFKLTNKHTTKASAIEDSAFVTANNIHGMFFKVEGDVATANQFFLTDTAKHFLRGALYFNATPNQDSLAVINNFIVADMKHLINTFKWRQ